jgi:hypothetical protein
VDGVVKVDELEVVDLCELSFGVETEVLSVALKVVDKVGERIRRHDESVVEFRCD